MEMAGETASIIESIIEETMTMDGKIMKKNLFRITMKGEWNEVVNIYKNNPWVHKAKISSSENTALHIAISDGQEDIVEELVRLICNEKEPKEALKIENKQGNTPLHLAASMGNVRMCRCIANKHSELVGARNHDRETPIFLAALHGRKDAFLHLHTICIRNKGNSYWRRGDGETILHCAIAGDYFDLAYQIIVLYKDLVNSVNEQGFSPLDLLASKPSVFRSGSNLSWWDKIIYYCISVDDLKRETLPDTSEDKKNPKYPENYQTCISFFRLLRNVILGETTRKDGDEEDPLARNQETNGKDGDVENPQARHQETTRKDGDEEDPRARNQGHKLFPANYDTCIESIKFVSKAMWVILGLGSTTIRKLQHKKEKHTWSVQIMNKLLDHASRYEYEDNARNYLHQSPSHSKDDETRPYVIEEDKVTFTNFEDCVDEKERTEKNEGDRMVEEGDQLALSLSVVKKFPSGTKRETAILIAAKNGVMEMVDKILELFPIAIHDMDSDKKNIMLLAVENRQPHVYKFLLKRDFFKDSVFHKVDKEGNSALHLAATLGEHALWLIPGAALQMQWEIKWYEYIKNSMPLHFFARYNKKGKTPKDVFTDTHKGLVQTGSKWLTTTSNSCSVVAALIATVAYATSATVPGGIKEGNGIPNLEDKPAFNVFAMASLVALCFSVMALVMFLSILTSRYQEKDFGKGLPRKLLLGLTSLFISIASMLISFCAGHFFVIKDKLKHAALPIYAVTCLPVTLFAIAQFPLYVDLLRASFKKVPQRSYKQVDSL